MNLSKETRDLLAQAKGLDEPSAEDRRRVRAQLALKIGVGAGVIAGAKVARGATIKLGVVVKIGLVVVTLSALSGGLVAWRALRPAPRTTIATTERPPVVTPVTSAPDAAAVAPTEPEPDVVPPEPPEPEDVEVTPDPAPSRPERSPLRRPAKRGATEEHPPEATPPPVKSTLERETAALRAVRAALRDGDGPAALAGLRTYEREFHDGLLAEEAAALRVQTLCVLGRTDEAADAAASFLARHPGSPHAARVERGCEGAAP